MGHDLGHASPIGLNDRLVVRKIDDSYVVPAING